MHHKVICSIPDHSTYLRFRFDPDLGLIGGNHAMYFSLSSPSSLTKIKKKKKKKKRNINMYSIC